MPRRPGKVPGYCLHRASDPVVCRIGGRDHYLGPYGSPESQDAYARLLAEWRAAQIDAAASQPRGTAGKRFDLSICEVLVQDAVSGRAIAQSDDTHALRQLKSARFPGMPLMMAAILGYVLGTVYTKPGIAELVVSEQENLVYIRPEGATGFDGIQSLEDLRDNWNRLMDAAGLTAEERREAVGLLSTKVSTVPGT